MRKIFFQRRALSALALGALLLLSGCAGPRPEAGNPSGSAPGEKRVELLLDGEPWNGENASVPADNLTVTVRLADETLFALPFSASHRITIRQPGGEENTVEMTGKEVRMAVSNCKNQDCVQMGEITRENLEERILGGFIICLPHEIVIEVN